MANLHLSPVVSLVLLSFSFVKAQILLSDIPVASCAGNVLKGTATYSTNLLMPTGETQRIPAGDYWNQSGAVWVFSTDTAGIQFGFAAIPGEGAPGASIPQAAADAIKIDSKDSAWTLSVPSPSVGEYDIVFGIGIPSTKAPAATTTRATWLSGACSVTYVPVASLLILADTVLTYT